MDAVFFTAGDGAAARGAITAQSTYHRAEHPGQRAVTLRLQAQCDRAFAARRRTCARRGQRGVNLDVEPLHSQRALGHVPTQ